MIFLLSIIAAATVGIFVMVWMVVDRLEDLKEVTRGTTDEVRDLRLKARTRISEYGVQSGEVSHEQHMKRLGRASFGRRVVVGGDDDSQQKQDLRLSVEDPDADS